MITCFGEALVDLLPDRRGPLRHASSFEIHSGGAPANVAIGLARLGIRTAFVGVTGDDEFGHLLVDRLRRESIDTRMRHSPHSPTGLWFIGLDERGERSFFAPGGTDTADKLLSVEEFDLVPYETRIFHCGTSAHVGMPHVLLEVVRRAKELGMLISFDPNVRENLWRDPSELEHLCFEVLPLCDIVKMSEEELEICVGTKDIGEAFAEIPNVPLVCITRGAAGAIAVRGKERVEVPAPKVEVIDTTGAGDGFVAGLLASDPLRADLRTVLRRACWVGSQVCTRLGAVAALPSRAALDAAVAMT